MYTVLPRILCVDDEPHVLDGLARNLRRHFDVTVAVGGESGLDKIEHEGPFVVVMSDQRMPGMDGVSFLSRVRELSPDSVRILLTGYADTSAAIDAVNRGAVFRFLTKPIEQAVLQQTLTTAAEHHRVAATDRVLLERTLHGSIKAMTDMLALVNPNGFGRALRLKQIVTELAHELDPQERWRIEIAAMLSQVGSLSVVAGGSRAIPTGPNRSSPEQPTAESLSRIAADVIGNIPRLEEIQAMIATQDLCYDGSNGAVGGPRATGIPLGSRMLKIALDLDTLESQGMPRPAALDTLRARWGGYDPQLLNVLGGAPVVTPPPPAPEVPRTSVLEVRKIEPGMILGEDIRTSAGRVLIGRGEAATQSTIDSVKNTLDFNALRQIVEVRLPS